MKSTKIQVAIAEDKQQDIEFIKQAFSLLPQYEIKIAALSGKQIIQAISKLKQLPAIVLMDMQMPSCDGLSATIVLKHLYPNLKIVGLSSHSYESVICEFMAEGGNGFLSKFMVQPNSGISINEYKDKNIFEKVLHKLIINNETYFDPLCHYKGQDYSKVISTKAVLNKYYSYLTEEQILLLHLLQASFTQIEIAQLQAQSVPTIKRKVGILLKKFQAQNQKDLVNITQMLGITKNVRLSQMYD